jgi:hypothetical protein
MPPRGSDQVKIRVQIRCWQRGGVAQAVVRPGLTPRRRLVLSDDRAAAAAAAAAASDREDARAHADGRDGVAAFPGRIVCLPGPAVAGVEAHTLEYSVPGVDEPARVRLVVEPSRLPCAARPYVGQGAGAIEVPEAVGGEGGRGGGGGAFVMEVEAGSDVEGVFFRCGGEGGEGGDESLG